MPSRHRQERQARRLRRGPRAEGGAAEAGGRDPLSVAIREGADTETLFAIHKETALVAYAHVFPPDRYAFPDDDVRARWDAFGGRAFVAELDGRAVGFACVDGCWLRGLYVLPAQWRAGIGSRLHERAVEAFREGGCTVAQLWVLAENRAARSFYERRGWYLDGEERRAEFPPYPLDVGYSKRL